jgi:hypothetical protein
MTTILIYSKAIGWAIMAFGALVAMATGLQAHRDDWFGGYGSYRRLMLRLGHICYFAMGALLVLYSSVVPEPWHPPGALVYFGVLSMVAGAITLPTVCLLAAWRGPFHLPFALPVGFVIAALVARVVMG